VAAIDLGTNTTRLLVADVAKGCVDEVVRRVRITRLGEGVDARRRLLPVPIARVRNCLTDYRRELESLGAERTLAIATSAVRDAENGEAFLGEVEWSYGFETELLSGDEEALMTLRGVALDRPADVPALVVDVGGGSTELIVGNGQDVSFEISLDVGSVRATERFLGSDPPKPDELAECAGFVDRLLEAHVRIDDSDALDAIGVAGTITALAALDLDLVPYDPDRVHGHELSVEAVERQLDRLAALPLAERRRVRALEPERAPVIVAGAVIVAAILRFFGRDSLHVSERDILDGAALRAAELPARAEGAAPPGAYSCC
jgi:exopolyphosphatase / guanosine-5'-triphosphate,3'-diphosphate pyrophosphatase